MRKQSWYLIDNDKQEAMIFPSLKLLKEYARKHDLKVKRSPMNPYCFYTESWVILPTR